MAFITAVAASGSVVGPTPGHGVRQEFPLLLLLGVVMPLPSVDEVLEEYLDPPLA